MNDPIRSWDGEQVRKWLDRRVAAAKLDQTAAERRGYEARDDYDKAAAEEWVCRALLATEVTNEQGALAGYIKELVARDDYPVTGIYDDIRFDRHVRTALRKIAKMTKEQQGFDKLLRFQ